MGSKVKDIPEIVMVNPPYAKVEESAIAKEIGFNANKWFTYSIVKTSFHNLKDGRFMTLETRKGQITLRKSWFTKHFLWLWWLWNRRKFLSLAN
ncbi:MAG: hypothetical protein ABIB71_04125 [Candidatus Woesearchaeota archaeon]